MAAAEAIVFTLKYVLPLLVLGFIVWTLVRAGRDRANVKHLRRHNEQQAQFEDDFEKFSSTPLRARLKRVRNRMLRDK